MKKITFLLIVFAFLIIASTVIAQDNSNFAITGTITPESDQGEQWLSKVVDRKVRIASTESQLKINIEIILGRLDASIYRLEDIYKRLSQRMNNFVNDGNLEKKEIKTKLDRHQSDIEESLLTAKKLYASIYDSSLDLVKSNNPKGKYPEFRQQVISFKNNLDVLLYYEKEMLEEFKKIPTPTPLRED